jgi:hypothetical protein
MDSASETLHIKSAHERPELELESNAPGIVTHQTTIFDSDVVCFSHRFPVPMWRPLVTPTRLEVGRLKDSISELSKSQVTALGLLLPSLLCGEESAFQVFWREGRRISNVQASRSRVLAYRIAADELEHERLLQELRSCCPVPDDIGSTLSRARRFFLRVASRDPALHFARVAALDSGVCVVLSALIKPVARATALVEMFDRIRSDEARHVRFSRQHSYELGADMSLLANTAVQVRSELVALLYPLGHSFEDLGVDADQLFRRINA